MHTFTPTQKLTPALFAATLAVACAAGTLTIKFGSAMEVEIDGQVQTFAKDETLVPTAIPCLYKMRPAGLSAGQRTFAVTGTDQIRGANVYRFPLYGDGNWVRVALDPYPLSDTTVTLTGIKATGVFYVDAEHGNDDWDGTADYEHRDESVNKGPKKTLRAANDAATGSYPIVLAAPGRYAEGATVATYGSGNSASSSNRRLASSKNIGFIATEGAENTFIVGAPDPTTGGNGADAVGGVFMKTTSNPSFIQGFTITGCYSPASQTGIGHYGSAFCGSGSYRSYCLDCVISNNYAATKYPATCYGVIQRSKIMENESGENITFYGWFSSCIFAGNRITGGNGTGVAYAIHNQSFTYFCTYDLRNANQPSGRKRLDGSSTYLRSGLVYGLTDKTTISSAAWFDSKAIDNPVFANADARDYRLGALSPAIGASSYATDLNAVASASEITVTATSVATRPFSGFEVNGEMVSASGTSYTFAPATADGSVTTVKAVYGTEWYVDCVNGHDANGGGFPAQAKATIRAATTNAVSGDVIHVAPGTYGRRKERGSIFQQIMGNCGKATEIVGNISANGCRVEWSGRSLTLENALFTKKYVFLGGTPRTVSFKAASGTEWQAETSDPAEADEIAVTAEPAQWSPVGAEGVRVDVRDGTAAFHFFVFPNMPGVISIAPRGQLPAPRHDLEREFDRLAEWRRDLEDAAARCDGIRYGNRHVKATSFLCADQTDIRDALLHIDSRLLMDYDTPFTVAATSLDCRDVLTGEGLVFVRIAPMPLSRPGKDDDFIVDGSGGRIALLPNGYPLAELAYCGGEAGRQHAVVAFQRALRPYRPGRDGVLLSNTWGAGNRDSRICQEFLLKEIEAGARIGVDVIQIDDGWQRGRTANSRKKEIDGSKKVWNGYWAADPLFWTADRERFPDGLEFLVDKAREKGMRFGLWFGPDSSDEAANWEKDADCLLDMHRRRGIDYFKMDSMKLRSPLALERNRAMFDKMLRESGGAMVFDLDCTAEVRPGFFGLIDTGPLFVENRYTRRPIY